LILFPEKARLHAPIFHQPPGVRLGSCHCHRACRAHRLAATAGGAFSHRGAAIGVHLGQLSRRNTAYHERQRRGTDRAGTVERQNLLYFESSTDTSGTASITATFKPGTDPDMAQVDVQNRLKTIEPRLPQMVRQTGVTVESAASGFLMMISLASPDGRYDAVTLSDYLTRNVVEEIKRVPGVGKVQNFGAERAMRIWVQPEKLIAYGLSMSDVTGAIAAQNIQIAPGALGGEPAAPGQQVQVP
jgi:hypothetical protein